MVSHPKISMALSENQVHQTVARKVEIYKIQAENV